jgi:hypothetical protein
MIVITDIVIVYTYILLLLLQPAMHMLIYCVSEHHTQPAITHTASNACCYTACPNTFSASNYTQPAITHSQQCMLLHCVSEHLLPTAAFAHSIGNSPRGCLPRDRDDTLILRFQWSLHM